MQKTILEGIGMGLLLSLMVGPIFFQLIQLTIEKNVRSGVIYVAGAWLSDLICILLVIFSWEKINVLEKQFHSQIGLAGGILLIASGLYSLLKKVTLKPIPDKKSGLESSYLFLNGFLVNSLNPLAILYWLAIASNATTLGVQNHTQITIFFVCIWLTLIIVDFFKIIFAKKLKNSLNHKSLTILHKALGVVVLVLGVLLLVRTGWF